MLLLICSECSYICRFYLKQHIAHAFRRLIITVTQHLSIAPFTNTVVINKPKCFNCNDAAKHFHTYLLGNCTKLGSWMADSERIFFRKNNLREYLAESLQLVYIMAFTKALGARIFCQIYMHLRSLSVIVLSSNLT